MDITPTPSHTPKWRVEGKVERGDIGPLCPLLRQRMEVHFNTNFFLAVRFFSEKIGIRNSHMLTSILKELLP